MTAMHFIVGLPRSGTTWLGAALRQHRDVAVFGESSFFGRLYVPPRHDGTYGAQELARVWRIQRTRTWEGTTGDTEANENGAYHKLVDSVFSSLGAGITPADTFRAMAEAVAKQKHARVVVEKTPHHVHWFDRLAGAFPGSRFVVMTRDPYGFTSSFLHRTGSSVGRSATSLFSHSFTCGLAWRAYQRSIARARRELGARALVVDLRQIEESPDRLLGHIQEFLSLELMRMDPPRRINTSFANGRRPSLADEDVFWINLAAGSAIDRAGYKRRDARVTVDLLVRSATKLPALAFSMCAQIPRVAPHASSDYIAGWLGRYRGGS